MKTKHPGWVHGGWVVSHRDAHDDAETSRRAITDFATNPSQAWDKFLKLVLLDGDKLTARKQWLSRGYVAHRVAITVEIK